MKVSELLQEARDELAQSNKWCQGEFHKADEGFISSHCALGGLQMFTHVLTVIETSSSSIYNYMDRPFVVLTSLLEDQSEAYKSAVNYLAEAAITDVVLANLTQGDIKNYSPEQIVMIFNDDDTLGTQENVVELYDMAIKQAIADGV